MMNPVWKPCFVCLERVEVPDVASDPEGAALVPICGVCRRNPPKLQRLYQDENGKLWELDRAESA